MKRTILIIILISFLVGPNIVNAEFSKFEEINLFSKIDIIKHKIKTVLFKDDFNREDQLNLGEKWTSTSHGNWSIFNNTARSQMPYLYFSSYAGYNNQTIKNGELHVKFKADKIGSSESWLGIQIRTKSPGQGWWIPAGGSGYILFYGKDDNNRETLAFSNSYFKVWEKHFDNPVDWSREMGIKFQENHFTFYLDGIEQGNWTDLENNYVEGYAGMAVYNIKDVRFDDFIITS